jgi:hypothetical protein
MTINSKLKKAFKILLITFVVIFAICDVWLRIIKGTWDYRGYDTSAVLGALLGSDLYAADYPTASKHWFKELDMLKLSECEWDEPSCELPGKMSYESPFGRSYKRLEFVYDKTSSTFAKAPLKKCLSIYGKPGWQLPYCNHWTHHDCVHIEIRDYVLQRPDYLNKIVQILEQPCKYFPTDDKLREVGAVEQNGTFSHSVTALRHARMRLDCDKKDKRPKRYILTLLDPRFNPRFDIVINRKE